MFRAIPFLAIIVIAYNVIALLTGPALSSTVMSATLPSGAAWTPSPLGLRLQERVSCRLRHGRALHRAHELAGPGTPLREYAHRLGERDIDGMDPLARQDVDAAGHRRRRRRDEDRIRAVVQLLDDQCRDQRILNLDQRRFQRVPLAAAGQTFGESAQERVAGKLSQ